MLLKMVTFKKKVNPRRQQIRKSRAAERTSKVSDFFNSKLPRSIMTAVVFAVGSALVLSVNIDESGIYLAGAGQMSAYFTISVLVTAAMGMYIYFYEPRIIKRIYRTIAIAMLFWLLLGLTKAGALTEEWKYLSTGTAVASAMILCITYNQLSALVLSILYAVLASFTVVKGDSVEMMFTMAVGIFACCFNMKEIRTRMKLIQISAVTAVLVFLAAFSVNIIHELPLVGVFQKSCSAAMVTLVVGLIIQGFLPIIEYLFGVVTSMTLLDYSDANQPLLRKLAMEAPGTFSHSLLVGTIAEKAAETISANGLLCRVGAYYHDIGKLNKPGYFFENQMDKLNKHDNLSPAMSKHVIVSHVKDGKEIAKEYKLPSALRQFIETHHGKTLIRCFYEAARRNDFSKNGTVNEQDYRYPGPYPHTKEAAIVMLADSVEGAVRAMPEPNASKIKTLIHNMAMDRLTDGQFDSCELTITELSKTVESLTKSLTAHHHSRIVYPDSSKPKEKSTDNQQQIRDKSVRDTADKSQRV